MWAHSRAVVAATALIAACACTSFGCLAEADEDVLTAEDDLQSPRSMRDGDIRVYFTNPLHDLRTRSVSAFGQDDPSAKELAERRNGDSERPDLDLVKLIDGARGASCSVLAAVYDFDIQSIAEALARAKERGCDVRVVTDGDTIDRSDPSPDRPGRRKEFKPEYQEVFRTLRRAKIPVRDDGPRTAIMHDKYVVVDGKFVMTGSWNPSEDDTHRFFNNAALIRSKELARRFTVDFERLFAKYESPESLARATAAEDPDPANHSFEVGGRKVELYFPRSEPALRRVVELTKAAKKSVHFLAFAFTAEELGAALAEKAASGVEVKGVFESSAACSGQYRTLEAAPRAAQKNLELYRWVYGPINFMHHKVIIIDEKTVIFGSFNFSEKANAANDENLLVITDAKLAKAFEKEHARIVEASARSPQPSTCGAEEK